MYTKNDQHSTKNSKKKYEWINEIRNNDEHNIHSPGKNPIKITITIQKPKTKPNVSCQLKIYLLRLCVAVLFSIWVLSHSLYCFGLRYYCYYYLVHILIHYSKNLSQQEAVLLQYGKRKQIEKCEQRRAQK